MPPENINEPITATNKLMADSVLRKSMAKVARHKAVTQNQLIHEAGTIIATYHRLIEKP